MKWSTLKPSIVNGGKYKGPIAQKHLKTMEFSGYRISGSNV